MPCEYFLLIRRQRRPCLLAIDDGLSLAGQHVGRGSSQQFYFKIYIASFQVLLSYTSSMLEWNVQVMALNTAQHFTFRTARNMIRLTSKKSSSKISNVVSNAT